MKSGHDDWGLLSESNPQFPRGAVNFAVPRRGQTTARRRRLRPESGTAAMIRRCARALAAMAYLSACAALGQDAVGASGSDENGPIDAPRQTAAENPGRPPPPGNPLGRIPIDSLSVTRERPLFSASRRPPPPPSAPPATKSASPTAAQLERPPLTLEGTAIGKPRDIALVLDEAITGAVRLHVGEAAEGWYLRSVDRRTVTLEKDSRIVVLSFPAPGAAPRNQAAEASDKSDPPGRRYDGRQGAKAGANWIFIAHTLY